MIYALIVSFLLSLAPDLPRSTDRHVCGLHAGKYIDCAKRARQGDK